MRKNGRGIVKTLLALVILAAVLLSFSTA